MKRLLLLATVSMLAATCPLRADPADAGPDVHVVPPKLDGPRVLNDQTKEAVIRGYLEAWQSLRAPCSKTGRICWIAILWARRKTSWSETIMTKLRRESLPVIWTIA